MELVVRCVGASMVLSAFVSCICAWRSHFWIYGGFVGLPCSWCCIRLACRVHNLFVHVVLRLGWVDQSYRHVVTRVGVFSRISRRFVLCALAVFVLFMHVSMDRVRHVSMPVSMHTDFAHIEARRRDAETGTQVHIENCAATLANKTTDKRCAVLLLHAYE